MKYDAQPQLLLIGYSGDAIYTTVIARRNEKVSLNTDFSTLSTVIIALTHHPEETTFIRETLKDGDLL